MASLKSIRKRITSTKATQKITKAMKMVAGARLTRAQQRIVQMRPYAVKTAEVFRSVAASMSGDGADGSGSTEDTHPLLARRAEKNVLFLVLSSDRGLCGGYNTNITKATERAWKEKIAADVGVRFATVGRKGREYLQRRKADVAQDFVGVYEKLDLEKAREIGAWAVQRFERGEVDAIYIIYTQFKSAITQQLTIDKLLPLDEAVAEKDAGADKGVAPTEFLFEPDKRALLERLVPMYIEISILRALLESQASEFGARMTAMDAATRNAKDMIGRLTLVYNRVRQAAITKELMEIIGGAEALKE